MTAVVDESPVEEWSVDPRIEARRRQVAMARWWRRLRVVVLVALVAFGVGAATRSPLLDVDDAVVVGADRSGDEAVLAAAGVVAHEPLVDLDPAAAVERVRSLPWVAEADLERRWREGTVVLTVVERQPAAEVRAGEQSAIVDRTGRVLVVGPPAVEGVDGLAVVEGVGLVGPGAVLDPAGQDLVRVAALLSPGLRTRVDVVRPAATADGEVELVLAPRGVVRFGRVGSDAEIGEKVRTLATVFAEAQLDCLATVDVRVGDTAVLTRDPTCG